MNCKCLQIICSFYVCLFVSCWRCCGSALRTENCSAGLDSVWEEFNRKHHLQSWNISNRKYTKVHKSYWCSEWQISNCVGHSRLVEVFLQPRIHTGCNPEECRPVRTNAVPSRHDLSVSWWNFIQDWTENNR